MQSEIFNHSQGIPETSQPALLGYVVSPETISLFKDTHKTETCPIQDSRHIKV